MQPGGGSPARGQGYLRLSWGVIPVGENPLADRVAGLAKLHTFMMVRTLPAGV